MVQLGLSLLKRLCGSQNDIIRRVSHSHVAIVVLQCRFQCSHETIAVSLVVETQYLKSALCAVFISSIVFASETRSQTCLYQRFFLKNFNNCLLLFYAKNNNKQ